MRPARACGRASDLATTRPSHRAAAQLSYRQARLPATMAKLAPDQRPLSILAAIAFFAFALLLIYATATHVKLGWSIYAIGLVATILGFASREDAFAVGGIIGLNLLVILDIVLRIGVLKRF
jgi:hypothetical protein